MILSAMMFALGFFASGLIWLAFSVALVRRTRRMTERRILDTVATRKVEFEAERDELRARHAVQMHRLEREVSRVLDLATAYRLESDIKERDLVAARAELSARVEELQEVEQNLSLHRELVQDLERRHADASSGLRAAQHSLALETKRRLAAEAALVNAGVSTDAQRQALAAVDEAYGEPPPREVAPARIAASREGPDGPGHPASVVPLPTRRLAGEAHGELEPGVWRAPAVVDAASAEGQRVRDATSDDRAADEDTAEELIGGALDEVRALRRAATQAGE